MPRRVLIADDHPIFRRGLFDVLQSHRRYDVVCEASDGIEALAGLRRHTPDIGVLDISMPELDGLAVLEQTRGWPDPPAIVLLTLYDDYVDRAMKAGARGYVLKEQAVDELVACLDEVASGRRFVSPSIAWRADDDAGAAGGPLAELTPTELRILRLLAGFKTSREIATILSVSLRTVQNHRANMCRKLGLSGAKALLQFAVAQVEGPE